MLNYLKCKELFSFNSVFFQKIFDAFDYPWEILPHLREIIDTIIEQGIDGYDKIGDNVLVGKNVNISKTALIEGPSIIGANTEIRHCAYLRGTVIIGDGCVIGNSTEIKTSVLMNGAQAPHFNYVGDSVLGERAHLGAGVICSNLRSDKHSVTIRTEGKKIDTGLRKFGAILADDTEIGCNTVLCPGTVVGKNAALYPLTLARGYYPPGAIIKA